MTDVLTPVPEAAATPPTPEPPKAPEAKTAPALKELEKPNLERRKEEVEAVGKNAIDRQTSVVTEQLNKGDATVKDRTPHSKTVAELTNVKEKFANRQNTQGEEFRNSIKGLRMKGPDGKPFTATKIVKVVGDDFYVDNGVDVAGVAVSRSEVVNAYIAGNKDAFVSELPPAQQKAAALHLEMKQMQLEGKSEDEIKKFLESKDPDEVNADVLSSARDMGLLTSQQFEKFVHKITGANRPDATDEDIKVANEYLKEFSGMTLVDPKAFKKVVGDFAPAQLKVQRDEVLSLLGEYKKELANPDLPENLRTKYREDLEKAAFKLEVLDELRDNANLEGGKYGRYIDQYLGGEISTETAQMISSAVESGDVEQILNGVFRIEQEMINKMDEADRVKAQAELDQKAAHRREMIKKMGLGGLGIALLLLYSAVSAGGQGGGH